MPHTSPPQARLRRWAAVATLAAAAFAFVTVETLPVGLLPQMAADLGVSPSAVGLLVTGYAAVVVVTAVPLTLAAARAPRRALVLGLLAVLVLSSTGAALASSYEQLFVARVVGGLAHAVFWSVIASLAVRLVAGAGAGADATDETEDEGRSASQREAGGRATALVFTGNSLAVVAGVPAGTWLGQVAGWRTAFAAVAVVAALLLMAAAVLVPPLPARGSNGAAGLSTVVRDQAVRASVAVTFAVVLAHFTAYTYLAPLLTDRAGFSSSSLGPLLAVFGAAGIITNLTTGGRIARRPGTAVLTVAAGLGTCLTLWALFGDDHQLAAGLLLVAWGTLGAAMAVALQTLVLAVAGASADVASAGYVAAYNAGIGGGALLGGLVLARTGLHDVVTTAAVIALLAVPLALRARALTIVHVRAAGGPSRPGARSAT